MSVLTPPPASAAPPAAMPYKIAVLVYIFNDQGKLLLLHRIKPPNKDLYSPIGGKLEQALGESPYACALREIEEEIDVKLALSDIRLLGIVSECAYPASAPSNAGVPPAGHAHPPALGSAPSSASPAAPAHPTAPLPLPGHWLMFCFEVTRRLNFPARPMNEGRLEWVPLSQIAQLDIPKTDREIIWPLVQQHATALAGKSAGDFFSVHIDCTDAENFLATREHPLA